jgi:hypothetical protein
MLIRVGLMYRGGMKQCKLLPRVESKQIFSYVYGAHTGSVISFVSLEEGDCSCNVLMFALIHMGGWGSGVYLYTLKEQYGPVYTLV